MDEKGQRAQFMRRQTTKKKEIKIILYNKPYKNAVLLIYYTYKTRVISMKSFENGICSRFTVESVRFCMIRSDYHLNLFLSQNKI